MHAAWGEAAFLYRVLLAAASVQPNETSAREGTRWPYVLYVNATRVGPLGVEKRQDVGALVVMDKPVPQDTESPASNFESAGMPEGEDARRTLAAQCFIM